MFVLLPSPRSRCQSADGRLHGWHLEYKVRYMSRYTWIQVSCLVALVSAAVQADTVGVAKPATRPSVPKSVQSESQAVAKTLQDQLQSHKTDLAALQKKLAKTPPKTDVHPIRPGEGLGALMRK